jgi:hypothetical protein
MQECEDAIQAAACPWLPAATSEPNNERLQPLFVYLAPLCEALDAQDFEEGLDALLVQDEFLDLRDDLHGELAQDLAEQDSRSVPPWLARALPQGDPRKAEVALQLARLQRQANVEHGRRSEGPARRASSKEVVRAVYRDVPPRDVAEAMLGGIKADACFYFLLCCHRTRPPAPAWMLDAALEALIKSLRHNLRLLATVMEWEPLVGIEPLDLEAAQRHTQRWREGVERLLSGPPQATRLLWGSLRGLRGVGARVELDGLSG